MGTARAGAAVAPLLRLLALFWRQHGQQLLLQPRMQQADCRHGLRRRVRQRAGLRIVVGAGPGQLAQLRMGLESDLFLFPQQGRLGVGGGEDLILLRLAQLDAMQKRRQAWRAGTGDVTRAVTKAGRRPRHGAR